jgi:FkbM family methyltransferase
VAAHLKRARKLLRLLGASEFRRGLRIGVAAAVEHFEVVKSLAPDLVIDVGANVGQFTLLVREAAPTARIVAFEPLSVPADKFERLFGTCPNVVLHRTAVGPTRGDAEMHVSARPDSSSLLPISDMQTDEFPGTKEVGREQVSIAPLTDFLETQKLPARTLLKIDVQGYELDVLRSAQPLLAYIRWAYVEASYVPLYEGQPLANELIAYLSENGLDYVSRHNPSYGRSGSLVQADFLFLNRAPRGQRHDI